MNDWKTDQRFCIHWNLQIDFTTRHLYSVLLKRQNTHFVCSISSEILLGLLDIKYWERKNIILSMKCYGQANVNMIFVFILSTLKVITAKIQMCICTFPSIISEPLGEYRGTLVLWVVHIYYKINRITAAWKYSNNNKRQEWFLRCQTPAYSKGQKS